MKALIVSNFTDDKYSLSNDYIRMLEANNIFSITSTNLNLLHIEEYVSMCDLIVITGGGDIDPILYHETIDENAKKNTDLVPIKRDLFEIRIVKEGIKQNKKILGICRGMQVINIALNGTLYQDIENHLNTTHDIKIRTDSILSKNFLDTYITVNSVHHQVIKTLGTNLIASAVSKDDNYIEAIESIDKNILGVQWHMERIKEHYSILNSFLN
ncbi:MAG: gamma-glutamyl-gamma-aminobutyrate hydrolase family protein [Lachnospirales bacterium]